MTRIIAGIAGSLRLEVPRSGTRPTSDRVREAIFSTLESWGLVAKTRVLDLYAGSGALGLEAASRGASAVILVEKHAPAAHITARNVRTVLGAFERGAQLRDPGSAPTVEVCKQTVQGFLDAQAPTASWDVALLDPPYDLGEAELTANLTALVPLLAPDAAVLVERSTRSPEPSWPTGLALVREKRYGETALWWAEPIQGEQPAD